MKVVLDTNIFISGVISSKSNAGKVIQEWQKNSFEIITSLKLLEEIKQVLKYPKIVKITNWDLKKIEEYIEYLHFFTNVYSVQNKIRTFVSDNIEIFCH
jgi:putative PIN family toxin of toxin-antitoxin system